MVTSGVTSVNHWSGYGAVGVVVVVVAVVDGDAVCF